MVNDSLDLKKRAGSLQFPSLLAQCPLPDTAVSTSLDRQVVAKCTHIKIFVKMQIAFTL